MLRKDSLLGRQLGNYKIERLLGRGGMASVYYGIDLQLQRPAAIKVIDYRYSRDPAYAERFVREARAMAAWRHPNIPQIYQAGMEAGYSFYAMEYIQGLDLEKVLQRVGQKGELLLFDDVVMIGRAVAAAIDFAHSKGAIHRDVKPSNVLISEDDRILLTDFGLLLEVDKATHGEVFGTPHYIAPEQAVNSSRAVPQSDIYALGVMLYEMLVGQLPFDDPSPVALALKHVSTEPPAPRQLNPDLSIEVEAVLLTALKKAPAERYQSGQELMDALAAALIASPVQRKTYQASTVAPATLAQLPEEAEAIPATTLSRLKAAGLYPEGDANEPFKQPIEPLAEKTPPTLKLHEKSLPGKKLGLPAMLTGGAFVITLAVLYFIFAVPRWFTATYAPSPQPSATQSAAFNPYPTSTWWPITTTPTVTAAITTPVPTDTLAYTIAIAIQKDDSLFMINQSAIDLPLDSIQLGSNGDKIQGDDWAIEVLKPGQCVTVWSKAGSPTVPHGLKCELVGEPISGDGLSRLWKFGFAFYYNDSLVYTCRKGQSYCVIEFDGLQQ